MECKEALAEKPDADIALGSRNGLKYAIHRRLPPATRFQPMSMLNPSLIDYSDEDAYYDNYDTGTIMTMENTELTNDKKFNQPDNGGERVRSCKMHNECNGRRTSGFMSETNAQMPA
ncbi:hypothetical protein CIHG_00836 [Coccidioides immitis H538.4]|uniref:Uncharacterized protein n=1 Tax=Coccidioides immitis H538.4 TaxID=396776 RepID=A0A0J8RGB7_COCIT|nr:hypothetical protein CIHG_00836 [Coccidioides immitis H538.4]